MASLKHKSEVLDRKIICNKQSIFTSMQKDISEVNWDKWGADYIIDSSGVLENTLKSRKILNNNLKKEFYLLILQIMLISQWF